MTGKSIVSNLICTLNETTQVRQSVKRTLKTFLSLELVQINHVDCCILKGESKRSTN